MKTQLALKPVLLYGFLLWLIPFSVGFSAFPAKSFFAPLFETIMTLALALSGVVIAARYFKSLSGDFLRQGVWVGVIWFGMGIALDVPFFLLGGPMQMSFANYLLDICLEYLIYPIITVGFGWLLERK